VVRVDAWARGIEDEIQGDVRVLVSETIAVRKAEVVRPSSSFQISGTGEFLSRAAVNMMERVEKADAVAKQRIIEASRCRQERDSPPVHPGLFVKGCIVRFLTCDREYLSPYLTSAVQVLPGLSLWDFDRESVGLRFFAISFAIEEMFSGPFGERIRSGLYSAASGPYARSALQRIDTYTEACREARSGGGYLKIGFTYGSFLTGVPLQQEDVRRVFLVPSGLLLFSDTVRRVMDFALDETTLAL